MAKANNYVTEKYLDKKLKSFKTELKTELKEDLYKIKDEIVGEIKTMREESDTHQFQHVRTNEELEEHDKRISALETA